MKKNIFEKCSRFFCPSPSWAWSYEGVVALGDIGIGCGLGRGRLGIISIIWQGVVMELGVAWGILDDVIDDVILDFDLMVKGTRFDPRLYYF